MPFMDFNREIPLYPKRRSDTLTRFSTLLAIEFSRDRAIAKWVEDSDLKANIAKLANLSPNQEDKDWLAYFLNILRNPTHSKAEQERARQHIFCFYQETCFWTTKKLWRKIKYLYPIATWSEVFECAGEDLETRERAISVLKHFDPNQSTKNYVKTMVYRKIQHWLEKQIGPHPRLNLISFEEQSNNGNEENANISLSQQQEIHQTIVEEQETQTALSQRKIKRDRILTVVEAELHKIEQTFEATKAPKIGKSQISLWAVLLLSYGLNLMQSGTAKLLRANYFAIDQSALSRHLTSFKITLFIKCVREFTGELKTEITEEQKADENLPIEQLQGFQELAQEKHKLLDDLLNYFCQNWIWEKVLDPVKQKIRHPLEKSILNILSNWLQRYFQLVLDLTCLSSAQHKKFNKVVTLWIQEFNL